MVRFDESGRFQALSVLDRVEKSRAKDIMWLEDEAEDTANLEDLKCLDGDRKAMFEVLTALRPQTKDLKKGDLVVAKCNEDGKRYTALVQERLGKA